MKLNLQILVIVAFMITSSVVAQSVEKQVAAIRAEVTAINKNAKTYVKTTKDVEGVSLEGTEATFFSSGKGLRKITAKMYGETYKATVEYFFQGEDLIFVYEKTSKYNGSIGMKSLKVIKIEEKRMYFLDGKMIRCLLGKRQIKPGSTEFDEAEYSTGEITEILKAAFLK